MAEKYNFNIEQGATFTKQITWTDSYGNAIDLTGFTISSQLRTTATATSASATFTCSVVVPPTDGTFALNMTALQTSVLTGSCYLYDVLATTGSIAYRLLEGKATIDSSVTR